MKILVNYDFQGNQLVNVTLQKLAVAPASPYTGQPYYNTATNRAMIWNGTEWIAMDSVGATMTANDIVTAINGSAFRVDVDNLHTSVQTAITNSHSSTHTISQVTGLQTALDGKETPSEATTKANTAETNAKNYADGLITSLVDSSPTTLDTLNELAQALGDDPNFATTITNQLDSKPNKFSADVGNGSLTSIVVTHNLNTFDIVAMLREKASPYAQVICDIEMTTENTVTLKFAVAPTSNQYRITIVG